MQLLILLFLLITPYLAARIFDLGHSDSAGRLGMALVFFFGALGHFVKTAPMAEMIPPVIPWRKTITVISGVLEVVIGVLILLDVARFDLGICIMVFLVFVFPLNIYAAVKRVPMGGHAKGPGYLWLRTPLQIFFIIWTWHFFIRAS